MGGGLFCISSCLFLFLISLVYFNPPKLIPEETTEPVDYETLEDNEPKIPYEEILPPQGLQDEIGAVVNAHLDDANAQIESYKSKAKDGSCHSFPPQPNFFFSI